MEIGVEGFKQRTEYTYSHSHHHRLRRAEIHVMNHNTRSLALQHTAHSLILKRACVCVCVCVCGGEREMGRHPCHNHVLVCGSHSSLFLVCSRGLSAKCHLESPGWNHPLCVSLTVTSSTTPCSAQ